MTTPPLALRLALDAEPFLPATLMGDLALSWTHTGFRVYNLGLRSRLVEVSVLSKTPAMAVRSASGAGVIATDLHPRSGGWVRMMLQPDSETDVQVDVMSTGDDRATDPSLVVSFVQDGADAVRCGFHHFVHFGPSYAITAGG